MSEPRQQDGSNRWYAVTVLFRATVDDSTSLRPLCEERVVLFHGTSESEVQEDARRYANAEAHSYKNPHGEHVDWRFTSIEKVEVLAPPAPGAGWEIASRFVRCSLRTLRKNAHSSELRGDSRFKR